MKEKDIRYYIVKDKQDKSITYFEYNNMNGYDITPKSNVKIKDAINVNKMVIINPTMINKMATKKLEKRFEKLLKYISIIFSEDDDTGTSYMEALNEINRIKMEMLNKYKSYLDEEQEKTFTKKLNILEKEVKMRLYLVEQNILEKENEIVGTKTR